MKINFADYLTEEEIKRIVESEIRKIVRSRLEDKTDFERVFNNAAYQIVFNEVDEAFDDNVKSVIKGKVLSVLKAKTFGTYEIFRPKSVYDREESYAYAYLQKVVKDNLHLIENMVVNQLSTMPKKYLGEVLKETFIEIFSKNKL